jgi:integrase
MRASCPSTSSRAHVPLAEVWHADVVAWISSIDLAPASVHYIHRVFSLIMELAVRDGRIARNPASGVRLPRSTESEKRYLTKAEVFRLADACKNVTVTHGKDYRALVLTLAYTGLRWGELAALRVGRVDLMRGRLVVAEAVSEVAGPWCGVRLRVTRDALCRSRAFCSSLSS